MSITNYVESKIRSINTYLSVQVEYLCESYALQYKFLSEEEVGFEFQV